MEISFFKTSVHQGRKKSSVHDHIMFAMDTKYCLTTEDNDHIHEVIPIPATTRVVIDGQVVEEETPFHWEIKTGGEDPHTHIDYYPFEPEPPEPEQNKDKEVENAYELLKASMDREELSRLLGQESVDYCDRNKQWTDSQKKLLNNAKRACLTLNSIKPKVDVLEGHFRQNRKQIQVNPTEGGDQIVADVLNYTMKHIMSKCNYFEEENMIFHNVMVPGRGVFHNYINRDENWEGDIVVENFDWDGIYLGPHKKNDGSDMEYATKASWHSIAELQSRYPDKAKKIRENYEAVIGGTSFTNDYYSEGNATPQEHAFGGVDMELAVDVYKKQFLLTEQYQKKYFNSHVAIEINSGEGFSCDYWSRKDIKRLETIEDLKIIPRVGHRIKVILSAGLVHIDTYFLDEKYIHYKNPCIPIFPAYCYRSSDGYTGKVEMLKDPQNEKNKHRSLMADLAIKFLNSVTYYDKEMFESPQDMYDFVENGNVPGIILRLRDINKRPVREEGFNFPDGLFNMVQIGEDEIKGIANVPDAMSGSEGRREESGVAIHRKIKQSLVGNEIPFDNFYLTKLRVFKNVLRLIPECWNLDRFKRLIQHGITTKKGVKLNGMKLVDDQYKPKMNEDGEPQEKENEDFIYLAAVETILYDADFSLYDVGLSETEYTPTMMLANLAVLLQAIQYGVDVGPEIINAMPMPQQMKDNIMRNMAQKAEAQNALENKKVDNEVIKSQIANQGRQ